MNTHHMTLHPAPFAAMQAGRKTIEMRLYDEKRRAIVIGDTIVFTQRDTGDTLTAVVRGLHLFADFAALYTAVIPVRGAEALGYAPGEAVDPSDMAFFYAAEDIDRCGVVGIELEVLP